MLANFTVIKIVAEREGVAGVGYVATLLGVSNVATLLADLNVGPPLMRAIASSDAQSHRARIVMIGRHSTARSSAGLVVVISALSWPISSAIGIGELAIVGACVAGVTTMVAQQERNIAAALGQRASVALSGLVRSGVFVGSFALLFLALELDIDFALLPSLIAAGIAAAAYTYIGNGSLVRSGSPGQMKLHERIWMSRLLRQGVATTYGVVAMYGAIALAPAILFSMNGPVLAGDLRSATLIGSALSQTLTARIMFQHFPRISAADNREVVALLGGELRAVLGAFAAAAAVVLLFREQIFDLIFSSSEEFLAASSLLPWALAGDAIRLVGVVGSQTIFARKGPWISLPVEIVGGASLIVAMFVAASSPSALGVCYLAAAATYAAVSLAALVRTVPASRSWTDALAGPVVILLLACIAIAAHLI